MHSLLSLQKELDKQMSHLGNAHPKVAETLNAIGLAHHHMTNNQDEAFCYHRRALEIFRAQPEKNKENLLNIALTLADIGNCHWKRKEYDQANKFFSEASAVFEQCKISKTDPKSVIFHQAILNRQRYLHQPCMKTKQSKEEKIYCHNTKNVQGSFLPLPVKPKQRRRSSPSA